MHARFMKARRESNLRTTEEQWQEYAKCVGEVANERGRLQMEWFDAERVNVEEQYIKLVETMEEATVIAISRVMKWDIADRRKVRITRSSCRMSMVRRKLCRRY